MAVGEATAEATDEAAEAAEAAEAKKVTILSALDSASLCSKIKAPYSNDIVVWDNLETRPGWGYSWGHFWGQKGQVSFFKVYNQKNYTKKDIVAFYLSELLIAMQTLLYFLANSMY